MAENLNYEYPEGSWSKSDIHRATYGLLYDYDAAMQVCPEGWHLPMAADWLILNINASAYSESLNAKKKQRKDKYHDSVLYVNGKSEFGGKLKMQGTNLWKSPNHKASNELGFNALPGGSYNSVKNYYMDEGSEAVFWVDYSWKEDEENYFGNSIVLSYLNDSFWYTQRPKNWRASVRCIRTIE